MPLAKQDRRQCFSLYYQRDKNPVGVGITTRARIWMPESSELTTAAHRTVAIRANMTILRCLAFADTHE